MKNQITIGTPLSPSATKVMLLGSGELGKEVIRSQNPRQAGGEQSGAGQGRLRWR